MDYTHRLVEGLLLFIRTPFLWGEKINPSLKQIITSQLVPFVTQFALCTKSLISYLLEK